jgi:hypothetical protein
MWSVCSKGRNSTAMVSRLCLLRLKRDILYGSSY